MPREAVIDLKKVRQFAQRGMSKRQIALLLEINQDTFFVHLAKNPAINEAIEQGRAQGCLINAEYMLNHAKEDPKSALIYLQKFSELWADKPLRIELSGGVDVQHGSKLPAETLRRMANAYIQTQGAETSDQENEAASG